MSGLAKVHGGSWLAVSYLACSWVSLQRWILMLEGDSLILGQFSGAPSNVSRYSAHPLMPVDIRSEYGEQLPVERYITYSVRALTCTLQHRRFDRVGKVSELGGHQ